MAGTRRTAGIGSTRTLALAVVLAAGCAACSKAGREAPSPPPIAASKPVPAAAKPEQVAADVSPATAAPASQAPTGAAEPTPGVTAPAAPPPVEAPAYTPGTSLPGAIPPSPLPAGVPPPTGQTEDPLKWLQEREGRKADGERRLREAEAAVDAGRVSVSTWEKTVLAFKNPFLPRPVLAPEDAQAVNGMDGAERVKWAEDRLAAERAALASAQDTLEQLKKNPPLN